MTEPYERPTVTYRGRLEPAALERVRAGGPIELPPPTFWDQVRRRPPKQRRGPVCKVCGLPVVEPAILLQGEPYHIVECFGEGLRRLRRVLQSVEIDCGRLTPMKAFEAGRVFQLIVEAKR